MIATTAPYPVPDHVLTECVTTASRTYKVPELVIRAVLKVEGGQVGTMSRNKNGTYDLGPMQINTRNLKTIRDEYPFISWRHITFNPCINIMVGTWFLSEKIVKRDGIIWEGVGDYHSTTPSKRSVYLMRFLHHYNALKAKGLYSEQPAQPVLVKAEPKLQSSGTSKQLAGLMPSFAEIPQLLARQPVVKPASKIPSMQDLFKLGSSMLTD